MHRLFFGLVLLFAVAATIPARATPFVSLVLSERGGPYAEVAAEIRNALPANVTFVESLPQEGEEGPHRRPRIVVAVGTHACRAASESSTRIPLLCVLVARHTYERIAADVRGRTITALLLDQPLPRQMALIRAVMPTRRDVGVLLGPDSAPLARALTTSASAHGLRLTPVRIDDPEALHAGLQAALGEADVLLAVPDGMIYNSRTLQNILRTAFQSKVPLVGFSPGYVKAGALAAVYSTPAQVGRQAGVWVAGYLEGRPLPPAQSPREFAVSVNRNVARALGIPIDDENRLVERLRRTEAGR